ncbi:MAG: LamG-like jellyroll fold domain-containing protein [Geminicoccaceae bacterium]
MQFIRKRRYTANGVAFDGTNDYLTRGADLTGVSDGKVGTFSCWVDFTGGDATFQYICNTATATFRLFVGKTTGNKLAVQGRNTSDTTILRLDSQTSVIASEGWHHIAMAWDLAAGIGRLYLDDVNDVAGGSTLTNDTIDYTEGEFSIGGDAAGSLKLNAQVADLYLDLASFQDIGTTSIRRRFISAQLKPTNLGPDGANPSGSSPAVALTGATATWHTNDGAGGGFTENGALADASSSPSD